MMESSHGAFFVVDAHDGYVGTISFADLKAVAREPDPAGMANARGACHQSSAILLADQTLEDALAILDNTREEHLPVVRSTERFDPGFRLSIRPALHLQKELYFLTSAAERSDKIATVDG